MQIATWNINGLRARLEFILIWLEKRQPDIVGAFSALWRRNPWPALRAQPEPG